MSGLASFGFEVGDAIDIQGVSAWCAPRIHGGIEGWGSKSCCSRSDRARLFEGVTVACLSTAVAVFQLGPFVRLSSPIPNL